MDRREQGLTVRPSQADNRDNLLIGGGAMLAVLIGYLAIEVATEPRRQASVREALLQDGIRPVAISRGLATFECGRGTAQYNWRSADTRGAACVELGGRVYLGSETVERLRARP